MTREYRKFDLDAFKELIASCSSFAEAARKSGRSPVGGTLTSMSLLCKRHGIDTSHMSGQGHRKGLEASTRRTAADILVLGTRLDFRTKPTLLRRALLELGTEHKCNVWY